MTEKELIKQKNGKALILFEKLNKLYKIQNKLDKYINIIKKRLEKECIHCDIEIKDDYISGGYLDREVFIKKTICKTCGKEVNREEETGGFG